MARLLLLLACASSAMPVFKIGPIWLADFFIIMALLTVAVVDGRRLVRIPVVLVLSSVLAGLSVIISSQFAMDSTESVVVGIRVLYVWLAIGAILAGTVDTKKQYATLLLQWFAVGAALSAAAAIGQAALGIDIPGTSTVLNRMSGLTGHANAQGGVLGVALPITSSLLLVGIRRLLNLFLLAFITVGLVLSASVSGMLAGLCGVVISLLILKRSKRGAMVAILLGTAFWIASAFYTIIVPTAKTPWDRVADTTGRGEGISTVEQRQLTWSAAWQGIQNRPFAGHGLDPQSGETYGGMLAHNILLLCWYQGGIILLLAVLAILFVASKRILAASLYGKQNIQAVVVIGAFTSALVGAMTGPQLYDRWFWLPVLLALVVSRVRGGSSRELDPSQKAVVHTRASRP